MIRYQAYSGFGEVPTDCCKFGVVDHSTGKEVCRVWDEDMARKIALLLDAEVEPETWEARHGLDKHE
jgi:hypothetical protein